MKYNFTKKYTQIILFFLVIIIVLGIIIFHNPPKLDKFNLKLNFPTQLDVGRDGREIFWTETNTHSEQPEAFMGELLEISVKIYNINPEYYKENLKNRKIIFTFEGLNPLTDVIPLKYDSENSSFKGSGKLAFPVSGNFRLQIGYDSKDLYLPRKLISVSNLPLPVLSRETKYQLDMSNNIFQQSKVILILTIIMAYIGIADFFNKFTK